MKCGTGEGWRRSAGSIVCEMKKCQGVEEYPTKDTRRKAKWIGYILHRNCLLRLIIAGTTEGRRDVKGRRGRRRTKLLDELKERKTAVN